MRRALSASAGSSRHPDAKEPAPRARQVGGMPLAYKLDEAIRDGVQIHLSALRLGMVDVRRHSRNQSLGQEPFVLGPDDRVALASRPLQARAIKDRDMPSGILNKSSFLQFERC